MLGVDMLSGIRLRVVAPLFGRLDRVCYFKLDCFQKHEKARALSFKMRSQLVWTTSRGFNHKAFTVVLYALAY